jgi:hypothetical protein
MLNVDPGVPLFTRALTNLKNFLQKGETWAKDNNVPAERLLQGRIAEDMNPLTYQIQTCSNSAKGVLTRVAGLEEVKMEDNETTFEQLYTRIDKTLEILKAAEEKQSAFEGKEESEVVMKIPGREFKFTGTTYLTTFALPNFFFHETTAYAILRKEGVPVGKMDFLGVI